MDAMGSLETVQWAEAIVQRTGNNCQMELV